VTASSSAIFEKSVVLENFPSVTTFFKSSGSPAPRLLTGSHPGSAGDF